MNDDSDGSEYVDEEEGGFERGRTRGKSAKADKTSEPHPGPKVEQSRQPSTASEKVLNAEQADGSTATKSTNTVLRAYRDLLNTNIADAFGPASYDTPNPHPPSQIGASVWSSEEKQRFFTALHSCGPGNLFALASTIGTKSEPEIKAYILLLQEGVRELDARSRQKWSLVDVPAAIEIGEECLELEEAIADAIEGRAKTAEEDREKQKWGLERWVLDEESAAAIDNLHDDPELQDFKTDGEGKAVAPGAPDQPDGEESEQPEDLPLSSDQLLKPSAFLQLSRSLFMNSRLSKTNWRTLIKDDENCSGPSMRRTAFEDYFNLVVSLTRRLMQVSMFQALSRMRASDDPRMVPAVHGHDVIGARELLGMQTSIPKYWADAVERSGVDVYVDSRKYRSEIGRQGTKNGVKLSKQDLQSALGVPVLAQATDLQSVSADDEDEGSDSEPDSDACTLASLSERSADDVSDLEQTEETRERRVGSKGRALTDRKRPLSPTSFDRAETRYLESLDRWNSTAGENELRAIFDLDLLPQTRKQTLDFPFKQTEIEARPQEWREIAQYEAPWERPHRLPLQPDFDAMGMEGARRRKRRRLMTETDGKTTISHSSELLEDGAIGSEEGEGLEDDFVESDQSDGGGEEEGEDKQEEEKENETDAASEQD